MYKEPRKAFLRASEIVSVVEEAAGEAVVRMRDGREYPVIATNAYECWEHIMETIDPDTTEHRLEVRNPFVEFALREAAPNRPSP